MDAASQAGTLYAGIGLRAVADATIASGGRLDEPTLHAIAAAQSPTEAAASLSLTLGIVSAASDAGCFD